MIELSQIHTSCKNCVFAEYKNGEQVGCQLNKIQDYEKAGIDVVDVYDKDNKKFKIINERFCLFYRNEKMMRQYPPSSWDEIVISQTKIPYHMILIVRENNSLMEIKQSLNDIKNQTVTPSLITLVNKQYTSYAKDNEKFIAPKVIFDLLDSRHFKRFSLKNIYNDELSDRDCIDLVFDSSKESRYPIYVVFEAGEPIPNEVGKDLNDSILIKMQQIGFVKPYKGLNGMTVNYTTHKKYGGNSFQVNIEDKIVKFEENGEQFIFNSEDIYPCCN